MLVACFSFVALLAGRSKDFYHVVLADIELHARCVGAVPTIAIISRFYYESQNFK